MAVCCDVVQGAAGFAILSVAMMAACSGDVVTILQYQLLPYCRLDK